ncbi:putative xylanase [Tetragenococcus muriaticus 3MR10-3]|uniref:Putative xylanase n=1 Tax=Tetragenococcus muriaticus 3MR10-3 TaxID=1302648 RepID=A0A091C6Y0_9ENTE|nr:putative xylanase [Tetragenococcus muriaticus 3MR10-3]
MREEIRKNRVKFIIVFALFVIVLVFMGVFFLNRLSGPDNEEEIGSEDTRIAAVGDSITYNLYVANGQEEFYPQQLDDLLGEGYAVHNFGVSNYAAQASSDFPYDTTDEYQESLDFDPEIVIMMLGTNDTKDTNWNGSGQFKDEYIDLLESYRDLPSVSRIILASPPAVFLEGAVISGGIDASRISVAGNTVEEIAAEYELEFVDMYEETINHPEYFPDGIHPNEEGSAALAELFYQQITEENAQ